MTEPSWYQMTISKEKWGGDAQTFGAWLDEHGARDWAIGNEIGLTGYEHLQVVVHFKRGVNLSILKNNIGCFGNVQVSHEHNFDYALKSGNYITSWKDPLGRYKTIELWPWQKEVLEMLENQNDRQILCIVNKSGNVGKSILAKYCETNKIMDVCPVVSEEYNDYTGYCFEFEASGYIFDIPRSESTKRRKTMWAGIETIKNGLLFEKRYHPRKKWIEPPKILIMTNYWPPIDALSHDRWQLYELHPAQTTPVLEHVTWQEAINRGKTEEQSFSSGKPCNTKKDCNRGIDGFEN